MDFWEACHFSACHFGAMTSYVKVPTSELRLGLRKTIINPPPQRSLQFTLPRIFVPSPAGVKKNWASNIHQSKPPINDLIVGESHRHFP